MLYIDHYEYQHTITLLLVRTMALEIEILEAPVTAKSTQEQHNAMVLYRVVYLICPLPYLTVITINYTFHVDTLIMHEQSFGKITQEMGFKSCTLSAVVMPMYCTQMFYKHTVSTYHIAGNIGGH